MKTFYVTIIISCSTARLIGVIVGPQGGSTHSSNELVIKGDNAAGGAASEVRLGALIMGVVGEPAPSARLIVWALVTVMSRVLTVTLKAIGVRWQLVLAQDWGRGHGVHRR
jgi:hypothetical protein